MKTKLWVKLLSFCLCLLTLMPLLIGCGKEQTPDNGDEGKDEDSEYMKGHDTVISYEIDPENANTEYILNSGDVTAYGKMGLKVDKTVTHDGANASAKWDNQVSLTSVSIKAEKRLTDITDYKFVFIWMYSEKITDSKMQFCIYCQKTSEGKNAYKRHEITVNWTGWKLLALSLDEFADGYGADFSQVKSYDFKSSGWSMTPNPETVVYIDSIYVADEAYSFNMEAEDIGDYNYDHIIDTLTGMLNGGMSLEGATGEYKKRLEGYVNNAKNAQKNLKRGADTPFAADMKTTAGITSNYNKIRNMAIGYSVKGSDIYKDKTLLKDIVYALDQMHEKYYKDKNLHSYPSRNNWWDWQIGSAQHIVNILMLIKDDITQAQIDKYLEPVNRYDPLPSLTMANRVDIAYVTFAAAALQKDYKRLALSREALNECCVFVESGDGFYSDGSFVQHDIIAYTGSYGPIMLEALSKIILSTSDTCFRFSEEVINHQYSWAVDSYIPLMYHGAFFGHVRGRSICRTSTDVSLGNTAVQGMLRMTKYLTDSKKAQFISSVIKEYSLYNNAYYRVSLSPHDLAIYDAIIADNTIAARTDFEFSKIFSRMDRPIAQLSKYAVGISLSSSRIAKYEAINEENGDGWYTGDGMLYVYTNVNDYNPEFWHNVNLYRLPGTTVTTVPRVDENISAKNTLSKYDFVGGVALNKSLVSAMQFESATANMSIKSNLNGKKAWFVFDNEIVCLGAGLSCSDAYNTETIIENRRILLDEQFIVNNEEIYGIGGELKNVKSIYFDSFGGVYLPKETTLNYNITNGNVSFLELYIDHGKNFKNQTYEYVLLPTLSNEEVTAYSANPEIEILRNDDKVMAVKDKSSGMVGYIFWEAGEFNGVKATKPCTVLVSDTEIAAADPTQKLTSLSITVDGKSYEFNGLYKGSTVVVAK